MLQGKSLVSVTLRAKGLFNANNVVSRNFGSWLFDYNSVNKHNFEKSSAQNPISRIPFSLKARLFSSTSETIGVVNKDAIASALNSKEDIKVMMVPNPSDKWWRVASILTGLLPAAVLLGFGFYYMNVAQIEGGGGNEFNVAPAHASVLNVEERFADVKGIDEAKSELSEVVDYLKNPEKYTQLGARLPKGVLLVGEPGNGKTLLARAVAGESGVPFFYVSGSAFDEMFVGVGPRRVRDLFEEAKKNSPCIIFIDEIDAIGVARRYSMNGGSFAKESTLNQLLTELDGFKQSAGIIVIAATNLPESLDPALTRPGRFDKIINVPVPDLVGRKQIIDLYLKKTKYHPNVDSITLARGTTGFTGAELSNLINIAAIKAATQGLHSIDMHTLEEARDDIIMGGKKRTVLRTPEDLKITAYHEAGHAICALKSHENDGSGSYPLHKATIMMRGNSLGVTSFLPERDEYSQTKKQMQVKLKCLMAGRVAEEIVYGSDGITTGASDDFRKASQLARGMVTRMGFSDKIGPVFYDNVQGHSRPAISEHQQNEIDVEVKRILTNSYQEAKSVLKENESQLHLLANALLKHETLSADDIKRVISNQPLEQKL